MQLRSANLADLAQLGAIALAAKASWGYPPATLDEWRADLTLTPEQLDAWIVIVAEDETGILGFAALIPNHPAFELEHMWVVPSAMRRGVGRALMREACASAASSGAVAVLIDSDPNAEEFYRRLGAERISTRPAPIPGSPARVIPCLRLSLSEFR